MLHIIYTHKGEIHQCNKYWTFRHAEEVLIRLGATYWEIGVSEIRGWPDFENKIDDRGMDFESDED